MFGLGLYLVNEGVELGASKLVCVFAESEKTVQWTNLRKASREANPTITEKTQSKHVMFDWVFYFIVLKKYFSRN